MNRTRTSTSVGPKSELVETIDKIEVLQII